MGKEQQNEYLTTREVAAYLRLNEKKVYALVADGKLPAARISGKWLFPKTLIDQWVAGNTVYPASGLMGALLDKMLVVQGSDDPLLGQLLETFQDERQVPVPKSNIGSLAGLRALSDGLAHLCGCHVDNAAAAEVLDLAEGCYLVNLFERQQGLFLSPALGAVGGLPDLADRPIRFAGRQPGSGTERLTRSLLAEAALATDDWTWIGPYSSHQAVALAVLNGRADVGLGIHFIAAECGLGFLPLTTERYKLAVPVAYAGHPQVAALMTFLLSELRRLAGEGVAGYGFEILGRLEVIAPDWRPSRASSTEPEPPAWA